MSDKQSYMCVNCGGGFALNQMVFDAEKDADFCIDCYPEEEFSVTVTASFGVMAKNQEDANKYILQQFYDGNRNYTSDVEAE